MMRHVEVLNFPFNAYIREDNNNERGPNNKGLFCLNCCTYPLSQVKDGRWMKGIGYVRISVDRWEIKYRGYPTLRFKNQLVVVKGETICMNSEHGMALWQTFQYLNDINKNP